MTDEELQPIIEPHMVKKLRNRTRLVDFGLRRQFLEELEEVMRRRRSPDELASRASREATNAAKEPAEAVVRDRIKEKLNNMNDNKLSEI